MYVNYHLDSTKFSTRATLLHNSKEVSNPKQNNSRYEWLMPNVSVTGHGIANRHISEPCQKGPHYRVACK